MKLKLVSVFLLFFAPASYGQGRLQYVMRDTVAPAMRVQMVNTFSTSFMRHEQLIPQNYYVQHLGFFCRQELKMQQAKIPITFRLGSMEQCNRLEQKPGYR